MANTLTAVIPKLLAQGLMALRENAVMPHLVNRSYEVEAGRQGSTVDVPIPSAIAVQDVTPAATPPATADISPTSVPIVLDRWKEAPFQLSDKEQLEVMNGTIPMQASEAVKALANEIDSYLLGLGSKLFGSAGTAGTTPFTAGTTADATAIRKVLNDQLAPLSDRRLVLDTAAEAKALDLRAFNDMSFSGDARGIIEGQVNRKFGLDFYMDQNVQTHTTGAGTGYLVNGTPSVGDKGVPVDTGTGTINLGDLVTFAGHSQTYVVTTALTGAGTLNIEPGLQAAPADNAAVSSVATHVMNLAIHRDCIALATRPLEASQHPGTLTAQATDPVTLLTLRLEMTREHKRDRFSYDILYGAEVVRRELGARLLG